ncbi:Hypothetical protein GbCGDNIH2_8122 [Granulibacter bethesdensis]|nr:Hypothetical protein GbCGDNIH2_8122 [Granulibacter bethesdensis]APH51888.1 Hypothetical protein GbCGDNIH5_8122 [Granulibacter bethesdensis]
MGFRTDGRLLVTGIIFPDRVRIVCFVRGSGRALLDERLGFLPSCEGNEFVHAAQSPSDRRRGLSRQGT